MKLRCRCGSFQPEGRLLKCTNCAYWQHGECAALGAANSTQWSSSAASAYVCPFCVDPSLLKWRGPHDDVVLEVRPKEAFDGCVYYRMLSNTGQLSAVRLGDFVYVRKQPRPVGNLFLALQSGTADSIAFVDPPPPTDGGAAVRGREELKIDDDDVDIMQITDLLTSVSGGRYLIGQYFVRPHNTFCSPKQRFHVAELFSSPIVAAVPLDRVVGRCVVLSEKDYRTGRLMVPLVDEAHVYFCQFAVDLKQRLFGRRLWSRMKSVPRYLFKQFPSKRNILRLCSPADFYEHLPGEQC